VLLKYLPLILGLAILAVAIPFVPWDEVWPYLRKLPAPAVAGLLVCSLLYYFGRVLRYWVILKMLDQPVRFDKVAVACLVAQPVAVLPGGELYRAAMLKRYGNVSLQDGSPSVFAQSIIESIGLVAVALVGALLLRQNVTILIGLAVIMAIVWALIKWQSTHTSHKIVNKVPGVSVSHDKVENFMNTNRELFHRKNFAVLLAVTLITTIAGAAMLYIAGQALGAGLDPAQSLIGFALPTTLEAVSFLPAGLGIMEQGSVGVLRIFGTGVALAVALTILVRLFTLGMGFIYGFAAMLWARLGRYERYD
jgi:uncharacterized protein (TIRG00374 family)